MTVTAKASFMSPKTIYEYATDAAGQVTGWINVGAWTPDGVPPVISTVDPVPAAGSASVAWNTDENSDTQVYYGPTAGYGSSTALNPTLTLAHGASLMGLTPGTEYYFEARSRDGAGNLSTATGTFTTAIENFEAQSPPPAATGPCAVGAVLLSVDYRVVRVANNTVRLYAESWLANPPGYQFDYRGYFVPHVSFQLFRNGSPLPMVPASNPSTASALYNGRARVVQEYTLQSTGPGIYRVDSTHWARSSYCESFGSEPIYHNRSHQLTILRPARPDYFPGSAAAIYLDGAIQSGTYYSSTTLLLGNPNGAVGTPTWSIVAGASHGSLSCSQCNSNTYTATQASASCNDYNVLIRANYGGFESETLYIFNNRPASIEENPIVEHEDLAPTYVGWESRKKLRVRDLCSAPMNWVVVNESFVNRRYGSMFSESTWPLSWVNAVWGDVPGEFDQDGYFTDIMFEYDIPGKVPTPMPAFANGMDEGANSSVTLHDQVFKAASSSPGFGIFIWGITQVHYLDHGGHRIIP